MSQHINQQIKSTGVAQVIVVLKSPGSAAAAAPPAAATRAGASAPKTGAAAGASPLAGLMKHFSSSELSINSQLADAGHKRVAGLFNAGTSASMKAGAVKKVTPPPPVQIYPNLGIMLGTVSRDGLSGLRSDDRVASVTGAPLFRPIWPERIAAAKMTTQVTWGISTLEVARLWKEGLTGKNILVGHLDTGADGKHPTLKAAIKHFAEFDSFGQIVSPTPKPFDTDEHGTHTAATIAGRPVGGKHVGVAHEAELASAIVIEGGNVIARVLGGMDWSLSRGVRILNMSLGFPGFLEDFIPITQILRARGVLPVMAVGNEGPATSRSPGNYATVISVGAHDSNGVVADFSSSQRFKRKKDPIVPDLVAPGVATISAKPGGGYQEMDGTSMATPHMAGLAALLYQARPDATVAQVERAIFRSCVRRPGMPLERGNRGIPNAVRALRELTGINLASGTKGKKVEVGGAGKKTTKKGAAKKGGKKRASKKSASKKR
ncbi:MAG TPA: S8 family serine peptidase [Pyrinomonadaceae bacterium]|nr:S8 family serine peptidase [Pyrinomonadaceae bacterium]